VLEKVLTHQIVTCYIDLVLSRAHIRVDKRLAANRPTHITCLFLCGLLPRCGEVVALQTRSMHLFDVFKAANEHVIIVRCFLWVRLHSFMGVVINNFT
jgi:hypothetical protein